MAKGLFSQGVCLLTDGQTTIKDLKAALEEKDFEIVKQVPAHKDWQFGGPTLVVSFLPEVNGYAAVDVVKEPWPDSMGDPKTDPTTFATWTMGQFGPFAFPGGLARAGEHSWVWEPGKTIAKGHRGFIRIRMSYGFGARDDDPILPADYDPLAEMMFLSRAVLAVFKAPGVICYFNPNGEVLRDRASFRELWTGCKKEEKIPLQLWMNVRYFSVNDKFSLMDTVGNGQLELRDVEAVFPEAKYDPGDIDYYLRNVTHYLLGLDRELKTGEEIDGPGESNLSWTTEVLKDGASPPPRRVLRLYPKANRKEIQALAKGGGS
jgi:Domain of unknown function (DUF4261)